MNQSMELGIFCYVSSSNFCLRGGRVGAGNLEFCVNFLEDVDRILGLLLGAVGNLNWIFGWGIGRGLV